MPRRARFPLVPLVPLLASCTFHLDPTLALGEAPPDAPPITCAAPVAEAHVLFALPRELREFGFEGSARRRELHYRFGPATVKPLSALLESCFSPLDLQTLDDARIAMPTLVERYAHRDFDYAGLARFARVSLTTVGQRLFVQVSLEAEFLSRDGTQSFAVEGEGVGSTVWYLSHPLEDAGRRALRSALASLRGELEAWGPLLAPERAAGAPAPPRR